MSYQPINFERVAQDLLADARGNLMQWFPAGKVHGKEFKVGNLQGEPGESLSINITTGAWSDFATGDKGGDLLSLYAATRGLRQLEAARELTGTLTQLVPIPSSPTVPAFNRPPADQPIPDCRHAKHGDASAVYEYRDPDGLLYLVARYDPPTGSDARKQFCPWTWVGNGTGWAPKAATAPRALFGLDHLAARQSDKVMIVEGEKAAMAARRLLPAYVSMTWAGGSSATSTADWAPLAGRDVILWPDADRPGLKAMHSVASILMDLGCSVNWIEPTDVAEGFDVADAEDAGWTKRQTIDWGRARMKPYSDGRPMIPRKRRRDGNGSAAQFPPIHGVLSNTEPPTGGDMLPYDLWRSCGLDLNAGGMPYPNEANIRALILGHPIWAGRIYYDLFRDRTMYTPEGEKTREWRDSNDADLTCWFQSGMRMPKVSEATVARAVNVAARANARNPLLEWLGGLQWDGTLRLEDWLSDCLGVAKTAYTAAVGRNWLVSMVARAYRPGCQVDTMPVLEGKMGRGKSSALAILGGEWYASTTDPFGGKAFLETIVGVWLIEIPDLAGFTKRDHGHIIATVTQRTDRYRNAYGRRAGDYPRTCVLAATSETDDYLADSRGIRRFWPLRCGEAGDIDLALLTANRDQLFAEAVSLFKSGAGWWDLPLDEARQEQQNRRESDPWTERVINYTERMGDAGVEGGEVLTHALEIPIGLQDQKAKNRVGNILRSAGYRRFVSKRNDRSSYIAWRKPWTP